MGLIIQFVVNLYDLTIFWYYLNTFQKKKNIPKIKIVLLIVILALIWTGVNSIEYPLANLLILVVNLSIISMLFEKGKWSKAIYIVLFIGVGIMAELLGMIMLGSVDLSLYSRKVYIYYFVVAVVSFVRGNIIYFICKFYSLDDLILSNIPTVMKWGIILIFVFSAMNCCFIINLMLDMKSSKSLHICISLIIFIVLTYCLMLFILERKQHEDAVYRKEMYYKEMYYGELEKRNEYVRNLKHDLKNKLYGLVYCVKTGEMEQLSKQLDVIYEELGKIDTTTYSNNHDINSVLRIKMGIAKAMGIETNVMILVPDKIRLNYGDIGVLYGNLLDNAIEASMKLPKEDRFIRVENKIVDGNMLLIIQNTKVKEKNEELLTTKEDKYTHGCGITSVKKIVEKYNGDISFIDRGEGFEVIAKIYDVESKE